jgi:hypothetical protein
MDFRSVIPARAMKALSPDALSLRISNARSAVTAAKRRRV